MDRNETYVNGSMIRKDSVDYRAYQVNLAEVAARESTMVVLSTGLGKTVIAALVAAARLTQNPKSKVLFLAPSRPLVDQQARYLRRVLDIDAEHVVCMTGHDSPENRRSMWSEARVFVMTPQALQNDLVQRSYGLQEVSLIVYDEAHRGVGNYAYTFVAELYEKQGKDQLSLGLTASPGHKADHIRTVCKNLRLGRVEVRTEKSPDVREYIVSIDTDIRYVRLPSEVEVLKDILYGLLDEYKKP
ncbi:MAG: DEAD/DEAH box helicase, partial [Candidatus Thorarchaeota archaeon]